MQHLERVSNSERWPGQSAVRSWVSGYGMLPLVALFFGSAIANAAETVPERFLAAVRERGYYDIALLYLDQLAARPDLNPEIAALLPYERALTLLGSAQAQRLPARRIEALDQARGFLQEFVEKSPRHPRAADANQQRAKILLDKARAEILLAQSPGGGGNKLETLARARSALTEARAVFQTAYDQYDTALKQFPGFIDDIKDRDRYLEKTAVEQNLIQAAMSLGMVTYEEAQTYESKSADFKKLLTNAAAKFQELHQQYRTQTAGLYGQMWEAKCYEELGDFSKALGTYTELLAHPGNEDALQRMKNQTRQFRLLCLNRKDPPDYALVVEEGEDWLKKHRSAWATRVGTGIRWEVARAYEGLADRRDNLKEDTDRYSRLALQHAQELTRTANDYSTQAASLVQKLSARMGGREKVPAKFSEAFAQANAYFSDAKEARAELDLAKQQQRNPEDIQRADQKLTLAQQDAYRMYELAVQLATKSDDSREVLDARYKLAYINMVQRRNYEAAILADFVARTASKDDGDIAQQAAYLAMAAFIQAYNEIKSSDELKQEDMRFIIRACDRLASRWPESEKANDARIQLGRMYSQLKQPVEAARWLGQVPDSDPRYAEAQLNAGQAYWSAYLTASRQPPEKRASPEQLREWQSAAEQHLKSGIARLAVSVPAASPAPLQLIGAKLSLAQIMISEGKEQDGLAWLVNEPHSVRKAIEIEDEAQRPEKGVQSRPFATEALKVLLRAYIGTNQLEEARASMRYLEQVAAGAGGSEITDLYVGVGRLLKEELQRYQAAGEVERFDHLLTAFENFMGDLAQRTDGQTFNSLSWIGETYVALGEATASDGARSGSFMQKAANAFEEIGRRAKSQADFATPEQLLTVKLRHSNCLRVKRDFAGAEQLAGEVVVQRPNDLKVQTLAAQIYQEWGSSGGVDAEKYLKLAMIGNPELQVWGWGPMSLKLQQSMAGGKRPELLNGFLESRYELARSRWQLALIQANPANRASELNKAEVEIFATLRVVSQVPDEWQQRFNALYRDVLKDSGRAITDLPSAQDFETEAVESSTDSLERQREADSAPPNTKPTLNPSSPANVRPDNTMLYLVAGGTVAVGLILCVLILMSGGKKKSRKVSTKSKALANEPPAKLELSLPPGFDDQPLPELGAIQNPVRQPRPAAAAKPPASKPPAVKPRPKPPADESRG